MVAVREKPIKQAATQAVRIWLADDMAAVCVAAREECRTSDGTGRADVVVAGLRDDGAIITTVIEAKSRFTKDALAAWRASEDGPLLTRAHLQLWRYPANYRVLACPENLLSDHPGDRALLQALCVRDGLGLLSVNWYREWAWLVLPRAAETPILWGDCLEGYACGAVLRGELVRATNTQQ